MLRYVHSGIFTDDQHDAAGQHTDFYLHTLGQYLRYFDGRPVTYVAAEGPGRNAFGMPAGLAHHLFAPTADREKTELAWRTWLDGLYG